MRGFVGRGVYSGARKLCFFKRHKDDGILSSCRLSGCRRCRLWIQELVELLFSLRSSQGLGACFSSLCSSQTFGRLRRRCDAIYVRFFHTKIPQFLGCPFDGVLRQAQYQSAFDWRVFSPADLPSGGLLAPPHPFARLTPPRTKDFGVLPPPPRDRLLAVRA